MKLRNGLIACSMAALTLFSCKKEDNNNNNTPAQGKASVSMHLTDDPGEYDAVYVDIQAVEVKMEGEGSVTLYPFRPGIYNLMDFRNGADTLLLTTDLNPGKVNQIRLILGNNNSVVVDGQAYPLNTPSAQESGLKLNLKETWEAGMAYEIWLDFDAGKSIVRTGNGKYNLKPVIRAYSKATDGRITGYVLPGAAFATVYATNGVDTYAAIPNSSGYYLFTGLPEGTYTVTLDAAVLAYTDVTINNVKVTYGNTVDLGTVVLSL